MRHAKNRHSPPPDGFEVALAELWWALVELWWSFGGALVELWWSLGGALVEPWWSLGGALGWPWGGLGIALGWLCGAYQLAINRPWGGFGWLCPAVQGSRLKVRGSKFSVFHKHTEYNSPPAPPSGWSEGTLDIRWYHPIPIEPLRNAIFDQASLFTSAPRTLPSHAQLRFACCRDITP